MSLAPQHAPIECTTSDQIIIDSEGGIRSARFDDIYFKPGKGAEETQHVFINGNHLPERWQALKEILKETLKKDCDSNTATQQAHVKKQFVIAETGFGTGLNFLSAVNCWQQIFNTLTPEQQPTLYFYSFEKYPLTPAALKKVYKTYNPFPVITEALLQQYPDPISSDYFLNFNLHGCKIKLILLLGDCSNGLNRLEHYPLDTTNSWQADAWFLDGFDPQKNSSLWNDTLFQQIATLSHAKTTAATFTVARIAKDALSRAGFELKKTVGFEQKRHMLTATYPEKNSPKTVTNSPQTVKEGKRQASQAFSLSHCYYRFSEQSRKAFQTKQQALVIGSGIAGCCTAYLLASRGWSVTLVDKNSSIANAASGNRAAVLFGRSAKQRSHLSDFYESSFHYALNFYRALNTGSNTGLAPKAFGGMLKLDESLAAIAAFNPELQSRYAVDQLTASKLCGVNTRSGGVFYPETSYLLPHIICNALLNHPRISILNNSEVTQLEQNSDKRWQALLTDNKTLTADVAIVCMGHHSNHFPQCNWLPIKAIRGQTSDIPATPNSQLLRTTICDKGYVTPAIDNQHNAGATFTLHNTDPALSLDDEKINLDNVKQSLSAESDWAKELLHTQHPMNKDQPHKHTPSGRVAYRATTPDYLPIVGPLAGVEQFQTQFSTLTKNARQTPDTLAQLTTGLYTNTGYGSHGFTLAPLASEILVAQICGEPMPISETLRQTIAPNRFLVRALIRNQSIQNKKPN